MAQRLAPDLDNGFLMDAEVIPTAVNSPSLKLAALLFARTFCTLAREFPPHDARVEPDGHLFLLLVCWEYCAAQKLTAGRTAMSRQAGA